MKQHKLLVVNDISEDEKYLSEALNESYDVKYATSGAEALQLITGEHFDMLITGIQSPGLNGEQLITDVNKLGLDIVIVAVTAGNGIEAAREISRLGIYDYFTIPFELEKLKRIIKNGLDACDLRREVRELHFQLKTLNQGKSIIGNSLPLRKIKDRIRQAAPTRATVLITGESGTGKELTAHQIHILSERRDRPYITVNCDAIPEDLLESELFGHEQEALTSAGKRRPGKFELANNGTILLDEIGRMPAAIQAKLLRIIQEGEFKRVGGEEPIKTDVRIIATSTLNLLEEIQKGNFREDLYYHLNVVSMEMPPLRERSDDIPLLVDHFINLYSAENRREPIKLTQSALEKLRNAHWSGNIRELENQIQKAVIIASGATLDDAFFQLDNERDEQLFRVKQVFHNGTVRDMEKLMILGRLRDMNENRTKTAHSLEISVRTIRNKLHEYNVPKKSKTVSVAAYDFAASS